MGSKSRERDRSKSRNRDDGDCDVKCKPRSKYLKKKYKSGKKRGRWSKTQTNGRNPSSSDDERASRQRKSKYDFKNDKRRSRIDKYEGSHKGRESRTRGQCDEESDSYENYNTDESDMRSKNSKKGKKPIKKDYGDARRRSKRDRKYDNDSEESSSDPESYPKGKKPCSKSPRCRESFERGDKESSSITESDSEEDDKRKKKRGSKFGSGKKSKQKKSRKEMDSDSSLEKPYKADNEKDRRKRQSKQAEMEKKRKKQKGPSKCQKDCARCWTKCCLGCCCIKQEDDLKSCVKSCKSAAYCALERDKPKSASPTISETSLMARDSLGKIIKYCQGLKSKSCTKVESGKCINFDQILNICETGGRALRNRCYPPGSIPVAPCPRDGRGGGRDESSHSSSSPEENIGKRKKRKRDRSSKRRDDSSSFEEEPRGSKRKKIKYRKRVMVPSSSETTLDSRVSEDPRKETYRDGASRKSSPNSRKDQCKSRRCLSPNAGNVYADDDSGRKNNRKGRCPSSGKEPAIAEGEEENNSASNYVKRSHRQLTAIPSGKSKGTKKSREYSKRRRRASSLGYKRCSSDSPAISKTRIRRCSSLSGGRPLSKKSSNRIPSPKSSRRQANVPLRSAKSRSSPRQTEPKRSENMRDRDGTQYVPCSADAGNESAETPSIGVPSIDMRSKDDFSDITPCYLPNCPGQR